MPPFREGPIIVDRRFDADALYELRRIGHEHQINIVDASYDIPRGAKVIKFPGSSAEALLGIVRLIPIEKDSVEIMERDAELEQDDPDGQHISAQASHAFEDALETARHENDIDLDVHWNYRHVQAGSNGAGFYDDANNAPNSLFVLTTDDLPFACVSLVAGHSQRTTGKNGLN
jgi:L-fucose mutarotase/ribose pyranase (RbsD/FucU family)